ncbi:MAG: hypothetical protein IKX85_07740 [Clostridia bacterium]|nr:hypothetical protein [Clostridia bacterium]
MKDQYIGDVGDSGKDGLLRYLALKGVGIGVNWYYTEKDEASNDGNINRYLLRENEAEKEYDPVVYEAMRGLAFKKGKKLSDIRKAGLIPNAVFYEEKLSTDKLDWRERKPVREQWHADAMQALADVELVFADPDTGTTKKVTRKGAAQYAAIDELARYYERGQDVVYYCHRARRTEAAWNKKKGELLERIPDATIYVLTFHRGMQRSYIFAVHPEQAERYRRLIDGFLDSPWGRGRGGKPAPFEEETIL